MRNGQVIAQGTKVQTNLYKMRVQVQKPKTSKTKLAAIMFANQENLPTWETWHRQFGHISYNGLKHLYEKDMVQGFKVQKDSPTPDCVTCTEAKQYVMPFNKREEWETVPGELTHIDLWGKYDVTSINGHQYYIVLVDNTSHMITVDYLKGKNEAVGKVKDYLTHLRVHGKTPNIFR
jgi:hypothetical protein